MTRRALLGILWVVLCAGAGRPSVVRNEIRFPDLPGYVTLKCDFHMHTVFSDGNVWPTVRVDEAWREGLDAIALTDHVEYSPHKPDVSDDKNRPYDLAKARAAERGILLIRGTEITPATPPGHHNAIFLADVNAVKADDFTRKVEQVTLQKAFLFWNHPGSRGPANPTWGQVQDQLVAEKKLHGVEVCNGGAYYAEAHRYALDHNLTIVGNSDMHDPSPYWNRTPDEHRTMTLVFAKARDLDSLREALNAGRTVAWCGNQLVGREPYLSKLFAGAVTVRRVGERVGRGLLMAEVENRSELDIELIREGADTSDARKKLQATVRLPAGVVTMAPVMVPAGKTGLVELPYQAANLLVGPNEPLKVKLSVNLPTTAPAGR